MRTLFPRLLVPLQSKSLHTYMKSGKKKADKLKENPRDTDRVSSWDTHGEQTGVYRPVSQGLPVVEGRKRAQRLTFWVRRPPGGKVRAFLRKFVLLGFRREESGMSRDCCCWDVPEPLEVFKKFVPKKAKVRAHFSFPRLSCLP